MKLLEEITKKEWEVAKYRFSIIEPFVNRNATTSEKQHQANKYNIHLSTLYRWMNKYNQTGQIASLVDNFDQRGGKGKTRIDVATEIIIDKTINDLYLYKQKFTPREIYTEIKRRCHHTDVPSPHENTVRNRIKALEDYKVLATRESKSTADRLLGNSDGMFPEGLYPLDVIQIDHTPIDIDIVDEVYRQVIGRPYLTLAIDVYSRMVTGIYIALEEPSYFSVSQCLSNSILPKEKFLRDLDIEGEWNICGIPRAIHLDNAKEFKSDNLSRVCENYNISIDYRPVKRPEWGAHIERLIGTTMREVHKLPGTTFANIVKKGNYKSMKEAVLTLEELEKIICEFLINEYHIRKHHGIEMPPKRKYHAGIFGDEFHFGKGLPELVKDEERFKISLLPTEYRTVQRTGVKIDHINYYGDILQKYIKAKDKDGRPKKFIFKRDPRDISTIWFYDPNLKEYFPLPYKNISFPPISLWELREIKKILSEKYNDDIDEYKIFASREKIHNIKNEAVAKTKEARKRESAKHNLKRKKDKDIPLSNNTVQKVEESTDYLFDNVVAPTDIETGVDYED